VNAQWQPRTRFPQPQEMDLQKATYLDVMKALLAHGADPDARLKTHPWYLVYSGCGNRNCGLADTAGSTAFWRAAYATDLDAMKLLVSYGADPNIPTVAPNVPVRRGGAGGAPLAAALVRGRRLGGRGGHEWRGAGNGAAGAAVRARRGNAGGAADRRTRRRWWTRWRWRRTWRRRGDPTRRL
jgi:hypothetical protein